MWIAPDTADADLVRALSARQRRGAANALFDRYWDDCWRVALGITGSRELAEEIAQEALLRLFKNPRAWDETRPLRPWLRRVAVNLALDVLRQRRRLPVLTLHGEIDEIAGSDGWLSDVENAVIDQLKGLSSAQRMILLLRYWGDLSVQETAQALDIPAGTVMSRCSRALKQLRKEFDTDHA